MYDLCSTVLDQILWMDSELCTEINFIIKRLYRLEQLLKLPQTELAQRLVTASLQLEERSCCIALLQESLANHKEQVTPILFFLTYKNL